MSAVRQFLLWMDALYWTFFGLLKNNSHYKAWKSQDVFEYNSDWICLKEESHTDGLRVSKAWANFNFLGELSL